MFAVAVILLLVATASAFKAPFATKSSRVVLNAEKSKSVPFLDAPANLKGMVGDKGFDPLGFSNYIDPKFLREAELKHGRIAMLATVGWIVTEFIKLPGDVHNVSPVAAHDAAVASGSAFQVLTTIAALEFISIVAVKEMMDGKGRQPGDYGFDPLGFIKGKSDSDVNTMKLKELENGRLAMVAFAGICTQAVLTGKGFPYM